MNSLRSPASRPGRGATNSSGAVPRHQRFMRLLAFTCVIAISAGLPLPPGFRLALAVTGTFLTMPLAWLAITLRRAWPEGMRLHEQSGGLAGTAFVVLAAFFDVSATLHHSPDLAYEANPVVGALLDGGMPLPWILGLGALAQCCSTVVACMLWVNFVMLRQRYLASLAAADQRIPLWMRMFGAPAKSYIAVLFGRGCVPWVQTVAIGPSALAMAAYRLWLGLEWFGWVPLSRVVVPAACLLGTFAGMWCWAHRRLRIAGPAD